MTQATRPMVDPTRCPLCGGDNGCAMEREKASGEPQPPCWCRDERFTPELLARIPASARGMACLCQGCARAALLNPPRPTE
jgi:hypothetical protein